MSVLLFPVASNANNDASSGEVGIRGGFPKLSKGRRRSLQVNASASQGRNSKRMKLDHFEDIPAVQNGVISASKTPVFDGGRKVDIIIYHADVGLFFDGIKDDKEIPDYPIPKQVKAALKGRLTSEESLRNAVYTNLIEDHGIRFPDSSAQKVKGVSKILRSAAGLPNKVYKEEDLSALMVEYGELVGNTSKSMVRIMKGLPVTTTSRPDLAPLDSRDGHDIQIRFGEFKNAKNDNKKIASTQCAMYLLALLYWLRTKLGKPVEAVYGFYFCGRRCEDEDNSYSVGFIKLSAPSMLGESLKLEGYETTDHINSNGPMNALIHFLRNGKRWSVPGESVVGGVVAPERRIPSLFTLPTSLWEDEQEHRQLIIHGTLSIVFLVSVSGLKQLLSEHFSSLEGSMNWVEFRRQVNEFVSENCNESGETKYYLKIRSKDTSLQSNPMECMFDAWEVLLQSDSISATYPVKPFSGANFGVALMKDRGVPFSTVIESFAASALLPQFNKIVQTAAFLSQHLPHGDVLPHNLVYDDEKEEISLIDIDEGVFNRTSLPSRKNEYTEGEDDWYQALRYPNFFVEDANRYTKVQLLASFLYILMWAPNTEDLGSKMLQACNGLKEEAKRFGESMCCLDKTGKLPKTKVRLEEFNSWVDKLELMINDVLECC